MVLRVAGQGIALFLGHGVVGVTLVGSRVLVRLGNLGLIGRVVGCPYLLGEITQFLTGRKLPSRL